MTNKRQCYLLKLKNKNCQNIKRLPHSFHILNLVGFSSSNLTNQFRQQAKLKNGQKFNQSLYLSSYLFVLFQYCPAQVLCFFIQNKHILNIMRSMYQSVKSMVRYLKQLSNSFEYLLGFRQGECLSPFYFQCF